MFQEKEYFYCYSTNLYEFLRYEKGFKYICTAFHDKTMRRFWQFKKTDELMKALSEYRDNGEKMNLDK